MTLAYEVTLTLTGITCGGCGITFGVPEHWRTARVDDHKTFYCPNGCQQHYAGKTEAEELRERLGRAEARITHLTDQRDAAERQSRARLAANTRLRKRVVNGVCPCCNRTFADLARHMAGQHPGYAEATP